jgi:threonine dehydrogenase-like Zn-dependent dehydrogenase
VAYLVQLSQPRQVEVRDYPTPEPEPGEVRVRTLYSGISAGTELATYRGTNPYLEKRWDPDMELFLPGQATFSYPVDGGPWNGCTKP